MPARSLRPLTLATLLVLASLGLAGCLGSSDGDVRITPYTSLTLAEPGRLTQLAFYLENAGSFREDARFEVLDLPENWTAVPNGETLSLRGDRAGSTLTLNLTPAANASLGTHGLRVRLGEAETLVIVKLQHLQGPEIDRGVGTQVRTVGYYDNGTVFYHNMIEVKNNGNLRKGLLGDESDVTPLKVYVGGTRRIPPPEPYASAGYVPVIAGFDEALYRLKAGETRVVHVPPEKAYTIAGNEDHELYGEALNFLITVESVDEIPDNTTAGRCPLPVCGP